MYTMNVESTSLISGR